MFVAFRDKMHVAIINYIFEFKLEKFRDQVQDVQCGLEGQKLNDMNEYRNYSNLWKCDSVAI